MQPENQESQTNSTPPNTAPQVSPTPTPFDSPFAEQTQPVVYTATVMPEAIAPPRKKIFNKKHGPIGLGFGLAMAYLLLFMLPILPGVVWLNGPGSSGSLQASGSGLSCTGTSSDPVITKSHTKKEGFPVAYAYNYQSSLTATCNGVHQSSAPTTVGSSNVLGVIIDVAVALVLAFITAKIVRLSRKTKSA